MFSRLLIHETLAAFAREGLRTLVLAQRQLTEKESDAFRKQWRAAETAAGAGVDRKALMAEAAATVELDLQIVGATAIEDKLQEGAPDCIAELADAGIKLWVLTGDKVETCVESKYFHGAFVTSTARDSLAGLCTGRDGYSDRLLYAAPDPGHVPDPGARGRRGKGRYAPKTPNMPKKNVSA